MTDSAPATARPAENFVFNPFDPEFADDPYPHYAELRAADPVHESPFGFWVLSQFEDVYALLRSDNSVDNSKVTSGVVAELRQSVYGDRPVRMNGLSMLDQDPPDHTRLRRLVTKAFTPRAVAALRPRVEVLVDEALGRIAAAGAVDLVAELAFPLPFAVISEMLGMPPIDHARLRDLTGVLVRSLEPIVDPELMAQVKAADDELLVIAADAIAWKRANPGDDLFTALIDAEDNGDMLSDDELAAQLMLLYVAGHETTVNLIGNGVLALLRHRDQLDLLRARPDLIGNAVQEFLRFDSPVQMSARVMLRPYQIGGRDIPPGSFVIAGLAAANRDRDYWGSDADELRIDRSDARRHVSFGAGAHHCLGAALARLEAEVAIGRLVARFPDLALTSVEWNKRINLRGPAMLSVAT